MTEKDVYEESIEQLIANIEKAREDDPSIQTYLDGQKSGYQYALATYWDCKARGVI